MRTILLVDDSPDDCFLFEEALKAAGAKASFRTMGTGEEAIAYLSGEGKYSNRDKWPEPDIVFLDVKLPLRSGFEVLERLRGQGVGTFPVVLMMSASLDPGDVKRAYQLRANGYLLKPGSFDELVELLRSFDSLWLRGSLFPAP
ncbi:MAG: response regulator [Elusimicrobia bacterium]|nr:response regulator [Elusimicrobiota bacterium]MDE2424421.1 response regulator [Elusimicrobiota bacterium]